MSNVIIITISVLLIGAVSTVVSLPPADNFREGSCSSVRPRPIKASRQFIDSLKYISGGSRFNLYSASSALPNYPSMTEGEFHYDACFNRNTTTISPGSVAALNGFGRTLATFRVMTRPGIYFEGIPTEPSQAWNSLVETVTLTDHKTYAVVVNCWSGSNQIGWFLLSLNGKIDSMSRSIVENHLESLGFKRENFVFIRYDSCRRGLGNHELESGRQ